MTPDSVFSLASTIALISWVLLFIFFPKELVYKILFSCIIILLALVYVCYIIPGIVNSPDGGFGSIAEVRSLFASDKALVAGWIHYLAFDLFVGMWITFDSRKQGINRWIILPCLIGTFVAGPFGLLLYFVIRGVFLKSVFQTPFSK